MAPNILWIMADELRASALGCYGGAPSFGPVATPRIDGLAAEGTRFTRHYCNSPACVPSRASMMSALAPEKTGVYANEAAWRSYPVPFVPRCFPQHFAAHGYRTQSFGKEHLPGGYAPWQGEDGAGSGMDIFTAAAPASALEAIVPRGIPSPVGGRFPSDRPYPPEIVTRNALDWLAGRGGDGGGEEPFLLRVSYLQPHTPVLPPEHFRARFDPRDFPGHDLPRGHGSLYEECFAEVVGGRALSHAEMQRAQADYHALVAWLDGEVGRVLDALEASGLADDTIVVFNADHGASLGENGLLSKVVHTEPSQRIPLIVRWPRRVAAGAVRDDLCEAVDLARTLCDLAGIPDDPAFEGRALFRDPAPEAVFSVIGTGHEGACASSASNVGTWPDGRGWPRRACVRTRRWRFDMNVRQDGGPVRPENEDAFLADSLAGPGELTNLAAEPAQGERVAAFRALLLARAADAVEPAFVPQFSAAEVGAFAPPKF